MDKNLKTIKFDEIDVNCFKDLVYIIAKWCKLGLIDNKKVKDLKVLGEQEDK